MDILVDAAYGASELKGIPVSRLAEFVIEQEGKPESTEVSISFVDNDAIADLNERYRGIEGPTDVLSFECDNADDGFAAACDGEPYQLGDIVIAPDVAGAQCDGYGNTFRQEIELLLVHGLLHLCGYDHIDDEDARVMESRERELLSAWREMEGAL